MGWVAEEVVGPVDAVECVLVLVLTAEVPGVPPRAHFETPRAF